MYTHSSTGRIARIAGLAVFVALVTPRQSAAQDPVRLPGVVVKATPLPGPKRLTGIVVDTGGIPIPGVEITIPELKKRLYSSDDGTFRFDEIPKGEYSMRARKFGFAPQVREFKVEDGGGLADFELLPIPRALPPIVASATRGGLSGVVGDTAYNPIRGAVVRVLGEGMYATTDSLGEFFIPAQPGNYMIDIARGQDYARRLVSVSIPEDSGRRIMAWLEPWVKIPVREAWNVEDLRERQAWIVKGRGATLYTREQLLKLKIEWIYDAVQMTQAKNGSTQAYDRDCWVTLNGGPAVTELSSLTIEEVESIEIYGGGYAGGSGPTAAARPRLSRATSPSGMRSNTASAGVMNGARNCPTIYVWTR
jgi:hypothetical protein